MARGAGTKANPAADFRRFWNAETTASLPCLIRSGVEKRFSQAKVFYGLYTFLIVSGAGFVLIPHLPLFKVIFFSQVANGVLLPFVLFYMLSLINNKHVMHEYKNNLFQNAIAWATSLTMILLTAKWLWSMFAPAA